MRASKAAIIPFLTSLSLTTAQSTLVYNNSQLNVQSNNQYSGASLSGYHVGAGTSYMVAGSPGSGFSFSFNLSASAYQLLNNDIVTGYQLPCYVINEESISNNSGPLECGVSVQDDDYFVASITPPTAQTPGVVTFRGIKGWYVCAVQSFTYGWIQRTIVGSFANGPPSGDGVQNCTVISGLAFAMTSSISTTTSTNNYTNTTTTKPTSIINPASNTTLTWTSIIKSNTTSTTPSTSGSISTWSPPPDSTFPTTRTVILPQSSPSVQSSFQVSPFPPTSKLNTPPSSEPTLTQPPTSNPATPTVSIVTPPAVPNQPPYSAPAQPPSATSDLTPPAVPNQPSVPAPSQAPSSAPSVLESSAPNQPPSPESQSASTTLLSVEPASIPFPTSKTSTITSSMVTMTRLCSTDCTVPASSMEPRPSSTVASSSGPYIPSLSYTSFVPIATWEGAAGSVPAASKVALVLAIVALLL